MTKTYTVFDIQNHEKVYARGLTLRMAMNEVIYHNHADWLLMKFVCNNELYNHYWQLYLKDQKYTGFYPTEYYSYCKNENEAELEIAEKIIAASIHFKTGAAAMEDIRYDAKFRTKQKIKPKNFSKSY